MGLFKSDKLLATVKILFYSGSEASVEIDVPGIAKEEKEIILYHLFTLYYAKMLYNLSGSEDAAEALLGGIQLAIKTIMKEEGIQNANILPFSLKLVDPQPSEPQKVYYGELYEKGNKTWYVQTHMSWGEESYYATVSTLIFLQHLINIFPKEHLTFLIFSLVGMNKYYTDVGSYSNIRSLIEAPSYGREIAGQIIRDAQDVPEENL